MGYSTDFKGQFQLDKPLSVKDFNFLKKLNETRRMARLVDEEFGVEGEFYVKDDSNGVIDHNRPPKTQPGLWCQWVPTEGGEGIEWDGGEKFYEYVKWLKYIVEKILAPRGYILNGEAEWYGEDRNDTGTIVVENNVVTTK